MFGFLQDMMNYDERKVDRYEDDLCCVSTARVSDGKQPYETGIYHKFYNDDKCMIVAAYDTIEEAQAGHNKWVHTMTQEKPEQIQEIMNSEDFEGLVELRCHKRVETFNA